MRYRPRWSLLTFGAIIVALLFTYPLWRAAFVRPAESVPFPLAEPTRRAIFLGIRDAGAAATAYFSSLTQVPVPEDLAPVPVPDDAQVFLTGSFTPINELYNATGTVAFYRLVDDIIIMRFEQFSVTNAPNLAIYLSANEAPTDISDIGGIVPEFPVGPLRGTVGDQQYSIPRELRIDRYRTVVIVSESLGTIYGIARIN